MTPRLVRSTINCGCDGAPPRMSRVVPGTNSCTAATRWTGCNDDAVGTLITERPRTEPYVRLSRIRSLTSVQSGNCLSACDPAPVTRLSGSVSGTCFAGPQFPWSPPFAPPNSAAATDSAADCSAAGCTALFAGFPATISGVRLLVPGHLSATAPRLPDADRPSHSIPDGRTRDLPASDAIPLHVMWPSTPAGRQHTRIAVPHMLPSSE